MTRHSDPEICPPHPHRTRLRYLEGQLSGRDGMLFQQFFIEGLLLPGTWIRHILCL